MKLAARFSDWLETRFCTPAYGAWILIGIALSFFAAATNTMAGWLYIISGLIFALLSLGAILALRSLRELKIRRLPISPVSVGEQLTLELEIHNSTAKAKSLIQVYDLPRPPFTPPQPKAIESISPGKTHHWLYFLPAKHRGVYRWHKVQIRSAAPLGLFWCRRTHQVPASATIYPQVLSLASCPLIDNVGQKNREQLDSNNFYQSATEGMTRSLRPYRQGDPTRLIHWRSSARYGELRVRELEIVTGNQEVIIALDNATSWDAENFEAAVVGAASLYCYATRHQFQVSLWTADAGLQQGNREIMEVLARVDFGVGNTATPPPAGALIWLTANPSNLESLPFGSRWLLFAPLNELIPTHLEGLVIDHEQSLSSQLQQVVK